ncbi:MAG: anti-sigma factor family protein [Blastocatellia bacterium]
MNMNCEHCQLNLEDFLYGELAERAAAEVRQHLADCSGCAAERHRLESENALFAEFYEQTAIEPSAESWEAIRVRIAAEPDQEVRQVQKEQESWWRPMFGELFAPTMARQAALAVLLVAVSVVATMWLMKHDDGKSVAEQRPIPIATPQTIEPNSVPLLRNEVANADAVNPPKPQPRQIPREPVSIRQLSEQELLANQLARTEREYQSAIKLLERAVAKRRDNFSPEAFEKYESSLALIDSSILQSKRALRELPNDAAAGQFLLAAYAKKVDLMQTIALQ